MDARTFFGLERVAGEPNRWRMEVVRALTSGTGALFGGCGLGASIEVMEELTGRPCIWATAQYLSFARPPAVLELDVTEVVITRLNEAGNRLVVESWNPGRGYRSMERE